MKIKIEFETPTIPDYINGQTYAEPRKLKISFDGEKLVSIAEFMDDDDKKEAVSCIRSALRLYDDSFDRNVSSDDADLSVGD